MALVYIIFWDNAIRGCFVSLDSIHADQYLSSCYWLIVCYWTRYMETEAGSVRRYLSRRAGDLPWPPEDRCARDKVPTRRKLQHAIRNFLNLHFEEKNRVDCLDKCLLAGAIGFHRKISRMVSMVEKLTPYVLECIFDHFFEGIRDPAAPAVVVCHLPRALEFHLDVLRSQCWYDRLGYLQ